MRYNLVGTLICMLTSFCAWCHSTLNPTIIEGTIEGLPKDATMEILLYDDYVKGTNPYASSQRISCELHNGYFRAEIPATDSFFYVSFGIFRPNQNRQPDFKINRGKLFLVGGGDSLNITVANDTIVTMGVGKALFDCQYKLWSFHPFSTKTAINFYNSGDYDAYFVKYGKLMGEYINGIMAVLKKFQKSIDPHIYNQLYFDWAAKQELDFINACWVSFHAMEPQGKIALKRFFYEELVHNKAPTRDMPQLLFSPYYVAYVLKKEVVSLAFKQIDSVKYEVDFNDLLFGISQKYEGPLRSKLTYVAFNNFGSQHEKLALVDSILSLPTYDIYTEKLRAYRNTNMIGTRIFPFEFHDPSGRPYTPDDFLGKTIILDFWFTGCIPCLMAAPKLKEFMKQLEQRSDIMLVSVNIERAKHSWIKSIEEGKYTSKDYLNLSTGGISNDFLKTYNITAFPRMVIFDRAGKIVSIDAPVPRTPESYRQLWELLDN